LRSPEGARPEISGGFAREAFEDGGEVTAGGKAQGKGDIGYIFFTVMEPGFGPFDFLPEDVLGRRHADVAEKFGLEPRLGEPHAIRQAGEGQRLMEMGVDVGEQGVHFMAGDGGLGIGRIVDQGGQQFENPAFKDDTFKAWGFSVVGRKDGVEQSGQGGRGGKETPGHIQQPVRQFAGLRQG